MTSVLKWKPSEVLLIFLGFLVSCSAAQTRNYARTQQTRTIVSHFLPTSIWSDQSELAWPFGRRGLTSEKSSVGPDKVNRWKRAWWSQSGSSDQWIYCSNEFQRDLVQWKMCVLLIILLPLPLNLQQFFPQMLRARKCLSIIYLSIWVDEYAACVALDLWQPKY